jgi:MFS family permease
MGTIDSNIRKIYLISFLEGLEFIGGVLIPFYLLWGKISFFQITLLQSIFSISSLLMEIPSGAIADRFGRKFSVVLSGIITVIAVVVYSIYPNFYIFIIGELLFAAGAALISGASDALVYDTLKDTCKEKASKKVFARISSASNIGRTIALPIGSAIAAFIGLREAMLFMALPWFIAFLIMLTLKEPKSDYSENYIETLKSGLRYFKGHRILKIMAFDKVAIATTAFLIIWLFQPVLMQLDMPIIYFGIIGSAITITQIAFMNRFDWLEKIFRGKKRYLLFSALLAGLGYILLGMAGSAAAAIIIIIIMSGFGLSRDVLYSSYMNKHIESKNRATVLSVVSMLQKLFLGIMYPLVGLAVNWSLNITLVMLGIMTMAFALISRVKEEHLID